MKRKGEYDCLTSHFFILPQKYSSNPSALSQLKLIEHHKVHLVKDQNDNSYSGENCSSMKQYKKPTTNMTLRTQCTIPTKTIISNPQSMQLIVQDKRSKQFLADAIMFFLHLRVLNYNYSINVWSLTSQREKDTSKTTI